MSDDPPLFHRCNDEVVDSYGEFFDGCQSPLHAEWAEAMAATRDDDPDDTATLDLSVSDDDDLYEQFASIYTDLFETFVAKNEDYGDSFVTTGEALAARDGGPFEDPTRAVVYHLLVRTGDKRSRLYEGVFGDGGGRVDESLAETARDAANYWVQIAWVLEHGLDDDA